MEPEQLAVGDGCFVVFWMTTVGSQVLVGVSGLGIQICDDLAIPQDHLGVEE